MTMRGQANRVPVILVYHSVRPNSEGGIYGTALTPERFERHIAYLGANYRIVPLREFVKALRSRTRSQGMLAITFDDGFADNLQTAAPILARYGCEATVFVTTGFVGRRYFWWDALHRMQQVLEHQAPLLMPELKRVFPALEIEPGKGHWFRDLWDYMRREKLDLAYAAIEAVAGLGQVSLTDLPKPVGLQDLHKLAQWPFALGSHAVSHRPLTSLPLTELDHELAESRHFLERHSDQKVDILSYPFGLHERVVASATRDAGYSCAVSVYPSLEHHVSFTDRFALMRVDASDGDVDVLRAYLERYELANVPAYTGHRNEHAPPRLISAERLRRSSRYVPNLEIRPNERYTFPKSTTPVHRLWGFDYGTPLDRPFIQQFIATHRGDVRGQVLEVKEPEYANAFACAGSSISVIDIDAENSKADIIDDLQTGKKLADSSFDCVILTQVLQLIPDPDAALETIVRILRPGGTLLLTVPGITQTMVKAGFYRAYFEPGLRRLLAKYFDARKLLIASHGNAGLAAAFVLGMTKEEVPPELFASTDAEYPIVLTARAVKPLDAAQAITWPSAAEHPDVSVIVPMFNAEATIREALQSVSRQSHTSYEILVVDDGSTDGSRAIVDVIATASGGIVKVLQHPRGANCGVSQSRNLGMTHARGGFIVFLDADDTIHPEKVTRDLATLDANPRAGVVVGRTLYWWDGADHQHATLDMIHEPGERLVEPPEFFNATFELRSAGGPPCVNSWMFRRSAVQAIEPFDTLLRTFEDQKFLAEASFKCPVYVASSCLCDYRRNENTLWANALATGFDTESRLAFEAWRDRLVGRNNMDS